MTIKHAFLHRIDVELGPAFTAVPHFRSICKVNGKRVNIRTATRKNSRNSYWFDVTSSYYENSMVDYFVYVCGHETCAYVIPRAEMKHLVATATLGGQKQEPNFTIFPDTHEFEPAGDSKNRHTIKPWFNNLDLLR